MKAGIERLLRRVGPAGVVAVGILIACGGFYVQALAPLEETISEKKTAIERTHARAPYQPVSMAGNAGVDLERFYALFPSSSALSAEVEKLHLTARKAGLELSQGEYRLERRAEGLWAYHITLPVHGTYAQLRTFLSAVLASMPAVSLDALRFERKKPLDTQLEAELQMTAHARPAGDFR